MDRRRSAVLAVAAALMLLGTARVVISPEPVPEPLAAAAAGDDQAQWPFWATMVLGGTPPRPLPLASSINAMAGDRPVWLGSSGFGFGFMGAGTGTDAGPGAESGVVPALSQLGVPYTQLVVGPTGQVLAVCQQRVVGWVPPCLLDGVAQAW